MFFLASASADYAEKVYGDSLYLLQRQLLGLGVALVLAGAIWRCWPRISACRNSRWIGVAALGLLVLPLLPGVGYTLNGASRWIGLGVLHVYALPLSVPLWITALSAYLARTVNDSSLLTTRSLVLGSTCLIILTLLSLQPDLSGAALLLLLILSLCASARKLRFSIAAAGLLFFVFAVQLLVSPYRMHRLGGFLTPFSDRLNSGYQLAQSLTAFGGGNFWGVGYNEGVIKGTLPGAGGSHILAVVAEEGGAVSVIALLVLAATVFVCSVQIAGRLRLANKLFESLLVFGLALWIAALTLVNTATVTGWLPATSAPFPFLSYGNAYLVVLVLSLTVIAKLGVEQSRLDERVSIGAQVRAYRYGFGLMMVFFIALCINVLGITVGDDFLDRQYTLRTTISEKRAAAINGQKRERRGRITDRFGRILAKNVTQFEIWIDPPNFNVDQGRIGDLAALLETRKTDLLSKVDLAKNQGKKFLFLKRTVDHDTGSSILALGMSGLHATPKDGRLYPAGEAAAQLIGIVDIDGEGQSGIEFNFNDELSLEDKPQDVSLSIDRRIQSLAFEQLVKSSEAIGARRSSAIVVAAKTGEVLAMASYPLFDPNERNRFEVGNLTNNAGHFQFEPAALLAPFTVVSALKSSPQQLSSVVDTSPGYLELGAHKVVDPENFGRLNLKQVLNSYSRVGLAKLALATPGETLWSVFNAVGFGQPSPIELNHLPSGFLPHADDWVAVEQAALGYGYGALVTPVQLVRAYTILANDGRDVSLTLLKREAPPDETVALAENDLVAAVRRLFLDRNFADYAKPGSNEPVVAAELSTSIQRVGSSGYIDRYLGASVLLVPKESPEIVVLVLMSEAQNGDSLAITSAQEAAVSIARQALIAVRDY